MFKMRLLITAGPTREHLDPVRFLSNAASGRIGFALAAAARADGHRVTLVLGPTALEPPEVDELVRVTSGEEMARAVSERFDECDAFLAAAAPCDFRPAVRREAKIKKGDGPVHLELERTPDILATMARRRKAQILVGFCLETEDLEERARAKLRGKNLDLIVANRPEAMAAERQDALLLAADGDVTRLTDVSKDSLARAILEALSRRA
jgi:phosphopantothenoylcysteine decarboxylase/phosphopantothenate--cysteine ligase